MNANETAGTIENLGAAVVRTDQVSPLALLQTAIQHGSSVEILQQFLDMQTSKVLYPQFA